MRFLTMASLAMLLTVPALAQTVPAPTPKVPDAIGAAVPPRVIDMTQPILNLAGPDGIEHPIHDGVPNAADPDCKKCVDLTLDAVVDNALFSSLAGDVTMTPQGQPQPTPQQKSDGAKRAALAMRLHADKAAVLSTAELAMIESRIKERFLGSIVEARALALLDPTDPDLATPAGLK